MSYCMEALELCGAFENADPSKVIKHRKLQVSRDSVQVWNLKAGIHTGAVSTGMHMLD